MKLVEYLDIKINDRSLIQHFGFRLKS